jgi:hypothetical protein
MIEQRPSHLQAIWHAFLQALLMIVPATLVCAITFYFMLFHSAFPALSANEAWELAKFPFLFLPLMLTPLFTIAGWVQRRSEPTRVEIEVRERAMAKRLLEKYPDLR